MDAAESLGLGDDDDSTWAAYAADDFDNGYDNDEYDRNIKDALGIGSY